MDKTGTILIVDDSSVSLMMLEGGLLPQYNVICATSGAEALGTARQRKPDLILLDIVMPKMDGFEVCRRLKQDEHLADIPVIMVTALDQAESELLGLKLGAIDFITKPYNLELVRLRVSNHLKLKFQSEELIKNRELLLDATEAANTLDGLSTEICVVDESGTITRTNQAWERFVSENNGVTELCGVGVNYLSVCSAPSLAGDKNLAELVDGIRSVLNGSLPEYIAEYQCNAPDKERWFTCKVSPFSTAGVNYAVIAHIDISWRKFTERELLKFSRTIEQSPVSVVITDAKGIIEYVNPYTAKVTGYGAAELVGQSPRVFKSEVTPAQTHRELWETISAGRVWEGELVNRRQDGSLFSEHAIITPIHNELDWTTHYVAIKEDITEKKALVEQLIRSQRIETVGQLAGGLAHDLNNILTVIMGYGSLLQIQTLSVQQREYVEGIMDASKKANALTHGMMAYSRTQIMKLSIQDINVVLEQASHLITQVIREDIEFTLTLAEMPLMVQIDPGQIEQVLMNLASNARDAMPQGGQLQISVAPCGSERDSISGPHTTAVAITVRDTGHGISNETCKRIFDPFFTTKEVGKGTGLGLSMVHGIVKQHNGTIEVESREGVGTTFVLTLPLTEQVMVEELPTAVTNDVCSAVPLKKKTGKILLVEDYGDCRAVLEEFLTRNGYDVIPAVDGHDAVVKYRQQKDAIRLVISDIVMPKMSGKEAYDAIRALSATVKFIFMSGHTRDIVQTQGDIGNAEILVKPISPAELLRKVAELF